MSEHSNKLVTIHRCDKCRKVVKKSDFDSSGQVNLVGRDLTGHAVGGVSIKFELCSPCTARLTNFLGSIIN